MPESVGRCYFFGFAGARTWNINRAAMEYAKMILRSFVLDCYEAVYGYCEDTKQLDLLQKQSWYQFTKMMRNTLTHTQHWKFFPRDILKLPVQWRNKSITKEMNGQMPDFAFFDWWDGCELWEEMRQFAENDVE